MHVHTNSRRCWKSSRGCNCPSYARPCIHARGLRSSRSKTQRGFARGVLRLAGLFVVSKSLNCGGVENGRGGERPTWSSELCNSPWFSSIKCRCWEPKPSEAIHVHSSSRRRRKSSRGCNCRPRARPCVHARGLRSSQSKTQRVLRMKGFPDVSKSLNWGGVEAGRRRGEKTRGPRERKEGIAVKGTEAIGWK